MDSIKDIWKSLNEIFRDEVRFYSLKGVEKSSLLLGLLVTILIISVFCLLVLIFGSIALAGFLNGLFHSTFLGYLIITGAYLLILLFLLVWMTRRKTPLLTNVFVRFLISIFNIPEDEDQ